MMELYSISKVGKWRQEVLGGATPASTKRGTKPGTKQHQVSNHGRDGCVEGQVTHVVCGSQSGVVSWVGLIRTQLISLELSIDDNTNRRTLHWQTVVIILTMKIVPNQINASS